MPSIADARDHLRFTVVMATASRKRRRSAQLYLSFAFPSSVASSSSPNGVVGATDAAAGQ